MKILLVHNYYQQRGGEDVVFEMERDLLRQHGHQVVEYCRSNHELGQLTAIGKLITIKTVIWASDTRAQFRQLLFRESPDIVHVHNTFVMVSPSVYSACQEAGVPVVQTLHNYRMFCPTADFFRDGQICEQCKEHGLFRGVRHGCYHKSRPATATVALMLGVHRWKQTWTQMVDRYIALSEFSRRKFCDGHIPAHKLIVKPNFIHPDPGFGNVPRRHAVFVGRLSPEKGLATLLSAWERMPVAIPLHIIGAGPLEQAVQAHVSDKGLSNVFLHGRLESRQVMSYLQSARFLVVPSECYENCPTTILEAYACGTPAIASDIGAMKEFVDNGRTGLHFRAGDSPHLAKKVIWAWLHREETERMGRQARLEYETKYTAENSYQALMELYQDLISRRLPGPARRQQIVNEEHRYDRPA